MKYAKIILVTLSFLMISCAHKNESFPEEVLNDTFQNLEGDTISFENVLKKHQGKKVVIDIWASWCKDCFNAIPKVKQLQKECPDAVYLFLSIDKNVNDWKSAITKYGIKGNHYFYKTGTKGVLGKFLNIDWVPRYLVLDEQGEVIVFKEVDVSKETIRKALVN